MTDIRILYFSWIRERVGMAEEQLALPSDLTTVGDLVKWMSKRDEKFAYAFEKPDIIRVALNKKHVQHDQPLGTPVEIAFFPPMTGG